MPDGECSLPGARLRSRSPAWQPLSAWLKTILNQSGIHAMIGKSASDDDVFISSYGAQAATVLRQTRLLLSDRSWACHWGQKGQANKAEYLLWHEATNPGEEQALERKKAKERVSHLLQLLQEGPNAWNSVAADDPGLSQWLQQPMCQNGLALLRQLSPDQLDRALSRTPVSIPVSAMSPAWQEIAAHALGASDPIPPTWAFFRSSAPDPIDTRQSRSTATTFSNRKASCSRGEWVVSPEPRG